MTGHTHGTEVWRLTVVELARLLASGELSAREALGAHLDRIEARNPQLNAVVSLDADGATARAEAADEAFAAGDRLGPLHGVPMTLKDAHDVAGLRRTAGTHELDYVPTSDGAVAARLRAAGANLIGCTNVPAWLGDFQCDNPVFGRTNNPWDPSRTPGGSSGGAAAAVSSGMVPADIGSDMVGSIRQPASLCGVYGLKTTEHRVPLTGHLEWPDASPRPVRIMLSLGPLARSVDDVELLTSVISGPGALDADVPPVPFERRADFPPRRLRLAVARAIPGTPTARVLQDRVRGVADAVADAGGEVTEALPDISWDEQAMLFNQLLMSLVGVFTAPPQEHTLADHLTALARRDALIGAWETFFTRFDALVMPPWNTVAFPHHDRQVPLDIDGEAVPYHLLGNVFALSNLNGLPGLAMPAGQDDDGLPTGIQLVGPRWSEATLLAVARGVEMAGITPGFQAPPDAG